MSIGENYEGNITPFRSDISRFSRGTGERLKWPGGIFGRHNRPQSQVLVVHFTGAPSFGEAQPITGKTSSQRSKAPMSKLFRNVPILSSLGMSPFLILL